MQKILKKIWDCVTTILVMLVLCLAILLGAPRFLHIQPLVVLSGSMEPVFMTGSLVYVQKTETSSLEVGDVITFRQDDDTVVTHRIIEVVDSTETHGGVGYRTKGDANEMEDAYIVPPENVIGKAMFAIPYLGYLAQYIQAPPGLYIAIVVGAGMILLMFLPDLFAKEEKEEDRKENITKADDDIIIINMDDGGSRNKSSPAKKQASVKRSPAKKQASVKCSPAKKEPAKKKRPLTPEEKRELARRRKLYEERKRELMKQKIQIKNIDDID